MKQKQYMPSNGTEGMMFMAEFCNKCYKESGCTILLKSVCGYQPKQWIYENDKPVCTSFQAERPKPKKKQINLPKLF